MSSLVKRKQYEALSHARNWSTMRSIKMIKKYVLEANNHKPLSPLQWFNLKAWIGPELVEELKNKVLGDKP